MFDNFRKALADRKLRQNLTKNLEYQLNLSNPSLDIITTLLDEGRNVGLGVDNARRKSDGATALFVCIEKNNFEGVKYLLTYGANINAANKSGQTPFELANQGKNEKIKELVNTQRNVADDISMNLHGYTTDDLDNYPEDTDTRSQTGSSSGSSRVNNIPEPQYDRRPEQTGLTKDEVESWVKKTSAREPDAKDIGR